jgi:glycerol-3-phosphate dehydrogenase (NAD(P)+)
MSDTGLRPPIAIIGAGSWGTALAAVFASANQEVRLWARRHEQAQALNQARENRLYLPGTILPTAVRLCEDMQTALSEAGLVILAVPAKGMQSVVEQFAPYISPAQPVLSAAKGLEPETGRRMSEIITSVLPSQPVAALSGPNLASEVAAGMPTTTVVASADGALCKQAQQLLMRPRFRVYTNHDLIGVELGGALKNIIAISAGISDGLGFGDNTKAALVTRGLAEMIRLGVAMGAQAETFHGLTGIGDLMATCASNRSRNHTVGMRLARSEKLDDIIASMDQVAEGVPTTRAAMTLAHRYKVEMPITAQLYAVLFEGLSPQASVSALMTRTGRDELE